MTEPAAAFSPTLPAGGLYIGTALRQRIDLIEHLLEFGHQMILLCGGPASGKSTLLASLAAEAGARWQCVDVRGGPALGGRMLLESVAEAAGVGVEPAQEDAALLERVRQRAAQTERAGKLLVLLVDDADQLPPETVAMLLALARHDDAGAEPRVLMTADQDHGALLAGLQRDDPQHGLVHVIEIPPLSEAQVEAFLAQRARAMGLALEDCLDADTLAAVTAEAQGNPGQVLALARQAASGQLPTRSRAAGTGLGARLSGLASVLTRRAVLVGAGVLGALVLGALLWLGRPPQTQEAPPPTEAAEPATASPGTTEEAAVPGAGSGERKQIEISLSDTANAPSVSATTPAPEGVAPVAPTATPDKDPAAGPAVPTPATSTAPVPSPAAEAPAAPVPAQPAVPAPSVGNTGGAVPAAVATAGLAAAASTVASAEKSSGPASPRHPSSDEKKHATSEEKKAAAVPKKPRANAEKNAKPNGTANAAKAAATERASKPTKPTAKSSTAAAKPAQDKAKPAAGAEQHLPQTGYTLQLLGVKDRAAASEFIRRHQLGKEARVIETRRNGQPWFTVAYGSYTSRAAAEAAAAGLPASARRATTPWVRALNGHSKAQK